MRPRLPGTPLCGFPSIVRKAALTAFASVILAACSTIPPIGTNEAPDALDHVRGLDLQPRAPEPTGTLSSATARDRAQVYYGSTAGAPGAAGGDMDAGGPGSGAGGGEAGDADGVTLNFEDTPVSAVAKVILGDYLGVGYAIDPRVQGTISLSSGRPVPKSDLLFILESALRTSNAVLLHDAGGYRIVPADDAVGSGRVDRAGHSPEPGYGMSVVPLRHVSVQTINKLLDSFATKPGAIRADSTKNLMIVIGNGIERRTAVDTILSFDEDWMRGQSVGIFPVHNTTPEPLITELEKILDSGEEGLSQHLVKLQPISRMNAVLVVARKPELLRAAEKWINRLDNSAVASTGVKVYRVRYGDCRQIAKLLSDLFAGGGGTSLESPANQIAPGGGATSLSASGGLGGSQGQSQSQSPFGGLNSSPGANSSPGGGGFGGGGAQFGSSGGGGQYGAGGGPGAGAGAGTASAAGGEGGGAAGLGGAVGSGLGGGAGAGGGSALGGGAGGGRALLAGVRILPDIPNNSIVVYANAESYRIIERALNQLDRPQAQVAVDLTIAEVTLNDQLGYGVQFFLGSLNTLHSFSNGVQTVNTAGTSPPSPNLPGFNFMVGSKLTPHVIISALHDYTTVKVLSNPSLVVVDNQVATLTVGDQIPVTTGSANVLSAATAASNTVFNSISYQNTGIILRIQPRINGNGNVLLDIEQEISQCTNCTTVAPNLTPTISERKVKSSILVAGGQTVLLAGLIQENQSSDRAGIPLLDQIPVIGEAFVNNASKTLKRTELIIFIRPQVIRDGVDASFVAEELRSKLRGEKIGSVHPPGAVTPYPPPPLIQ